MIDGWVASGSFTQLKEMLNCNETETNRLRWAIHVPSHYVVHSLSQADSLPPLMELARPLKLRKVGLEKPENPEEPQSTEESKKPKELDPAARAASWTLPYLEIFNRDPYYKNWRAERRKSLLRARTPWAYL